MAPAARPLSVLFLGVDACTPTKGENTASFLVDGRVVVDTGWFLVDRLLAADVDPLGIEAVLLTHCHHDHILGLPQLFFYHGIRRSPRLPRLYGPRGEASRVAADAARFLQVDRYPELELELEVIEVAPGQRFALAGLQASACAARHALPGLCYRIERPAGPSVVFSGDTAPNPELAELARGADLLVHECSLGAASAPDGRAWGHSGAADAAELARQAAVGRLALVHCPAERRQAALAAATARFAESVLPRDGEELAVHPAPRPGGPL
ncbi:MAG: MBL fold metallo-hydrolase [Candidatus Brocadiia bacterium]